MNLKSELKPHDRVRSFRSRPQLECAQCGDPLFIPDWSEHVDSSRIRHLWRCEACGYAFESTVYFAAA